ncbi:TatD family hydrolase [Halobacteriovorax sp.]|uniref:TatD family hydrolase n=1 Tax=Halobacteriovorax sp. TaxID=2020862 RepID=UPI003562B9FF
MILNFHTHSPRKEDGVISFYNADIRNGEKEFTLGDYRCAGIHPWWIDDFDEESRDKILKTFLSESITCIGEIGLDRSFKSVEFSKQVEFFEFQLKIAIDRKDKFIIIHCVRAYQEILNSVKKVGYKGVLVFHDYNGNEEMTEKLLGRGDYFSYGNMLFQKESKAMNSLSHIPLNRLFIETDDQSRFSIDEAYREASIFLGIKMDNLSQQSMKNFIYLKNL